MLNLFAGWFERTLFLGVGRAWFDPLKVIGYLGIQDALLLKLFTLNLDQFSGLYITLRNSTAHPSIHRDGVWNVSVVRHLRGEDQKAGQ